jgi:predicted ATP-dependent endonuclease of OLD family
MKLKWFRVQEFQSVKDSGVIKVDDITCLVGKNEAGKTALLQALYRLNPLVSTDGTFNVTLDYPRMYVEDYRFEIEAKKRAPAVPIQACYSLDEEELTEIKDLFGEDCITNSEVTLCKNYDNKVTYSFTVDNGKALAYLIDNADFSEQTREAIKSTKRTADALLAVLQTQEQTEKVQRVSNLLGMIKTQNVNGYIWDNILKSRWPKFLYFDEYYQMTGHDNIDALIQREATNQLLPSDHPLLGLVRLARLQLNELLNPNSTIELRNRLEGASNHLTKQVLKYWSQNKHLKMNFDVRPARPGDPPGMQSGTNIWGGVLDTRHQVTTELGTRSRGFVWFFSFLAWYSDVKRNGGQVILLLDEPGLSLHAKAQHDLLHYFEVELKPYHQLIYSTHSPFMIDPCHFDRVRIVEDKSIDAEDDADLEDSGTTVLIDIFAASPDSLFPLQGALGYELHQTLFVGPNNIVVEGVADLFYLQAMSAILQEEGYKGLDKRWTITPVGGSSKVPTFVALLGSQRKMTIATLIDMQASDRQSIEALYKEKLLKKANVLTFADFTKTTEADVEDMFGAEFYVDLVNAEFSSQLAAPIDISKLNLKLPRVLLSLEQYFSASPLKSGQFNHYRPARYLNENIKELAKKIPVDAKKRFANAFEALNALLK